MTGAATDVLAVARRNLGYVEGPGENENIFCDDVGHANFQPWCASFALACLKAADVPLTGRSAFTPTLAESYRQAEAFHGDGAIGDLIFFAWPSMKRICHVGIVEQVREEGSYVCIEGNTDAKGGRTGGRVMRHVRRAHIAGFGRPPYTASGPKEQLGHDPVLREGDRGQKVLNAQNALRRDGSSVLLNGIFDQATANAVVAFKKRHGLPGTAVVDQLTWEAMRKLVHA